MVKLKNNNNGYIQTFTGKKFNPLDPHFNSLCIEDMAHCLSVIPRFMGHTRVPYWVANHCLIGSIWFYKQKRFYESKCFLVHEPEEPYLGDMPTPIKYLPQMLPYRVLGKGVKEAWFRKLGIFDVPPTIKELDTRLLVAEYKALFDKQDKKWLKGFGKMDTSDLIIKPYTSWRKLERDFLKQYDRLFDKRV